MENVIFCEVCNTWKTRKHCWQILATRYLYQEQLQTFLNFITQKYYSLSSFHCVKRVQIRSFFCSVFSCIWTEYRKIRTRKRLYLNPFHAVFPSKNEKRFYKSVKINYYKITVTASANFILKWSLQGQLITDKNRKVLLQLTSVCTTNTER